VGLLAVAVVPARSDVVLLGQADFTAQGFGNANRLITVQAQGNNTTESGSVFPVNGAVAGTGDVVSPLADNQKFGIPTLASLGWTTASQVGLLFNASEHGGDSVTFPVNGITLTFYNGNTAVGSISNNQIITIADTIAGNGSAGFLFGISPSEWATLNSLVFDQSGSGNFRLGIDTTINDVAGGPESFNAVAAVPVPPAAMLFSSGIFGVILLARRKKKAQLPLG
jgi:hypothetical protein